VERALEVVVYGPLGAALFARDAMPSFVKMFVARGRSALDQQVHQARTVGQFAVKFGGPAVQQRVEEGVAAARAHAESTVASLAIGGPRPASSSAPRRNGDRPSPAATDDAAAPVRRTTTVATPSPATDSPSVSELAIPDYDELSASQVVQRLEGLSRSDLKAARDYETAHRGRRTILGKIAQLRA